MRLSPLKIYTIKLFIFCTVLLYLAIDLFVWHGPVWKAAYGERAAARGGTGTVVAEVYGEPITEEQLARHTAEQDLLAGRTRPEPQRRASRLLELVRAAELRTRTRYNDLNLPPRKQEAMEEVARLATRARGGQDFLGHLAAQGYTRETFTAKMEARMRQQAQLERAIQSFCQVTDEEIAACYEQMKDRLQVPAMRRVRHIFLATLHHKDEEVKAQAEALLQRLQAGEDFSALAKLSEDARSAAKGGDLGMIPDTDRRPLPELPLFGEQAIPAGVPTLARSQWGWHILLAEETVPARQSTLEECRESLRSALVSARRELAADAYFEAALKEGRQHKRIHIHVP